MTPIPHVENGLFMQHRPAVITACRQFRQPRKDVDFRHRLERSSWVAARILPSSHTNPVFVEVAGAPIRASRLI